jgi:serine phosphatase RsbU (regulator of sigma subunit)
MPCELIIRLRNGASRSYALAQDSVTLGRSAVNNLHFEDEGLSRKHLLLEPRAEGWALSDCLSKNGTFLNGKRVTESQALRHGDRIHAGHLTIEFREQGQADSSSTPIEFEDRPSDSRLTTATNLAAATNRAVTSSADGDRVRRHMNALIRAGRELAARRPLTELFQIIVELLVDAVGAPRGVLMTVEGGNRVIRAITGHPPGEPFRVSRSVVERVLGKRESVMERDVSHSAIADQVTLHDQKVRSFIAAPLQTDQRVLGLIYLDSFELIHEFTNDDLDLLTVMANIAALHIEHARMAEVEEIEREVRRDLEQAAEIQRILLPGAPPKVDGLDVAGYSIPCRTIGGDYYDFVQRKDERVAVIIADVAGKGLPAALLMSNLQARVEMLFGDADDLADAVGRLNRMICCHVPVNRFVSFFVAVIHPKLGELRYCNAGHNPPLLVRAGESVDRLEVGGRLLGIDRQASYKHADLNLQAGDALVLFSDGVTEACRPDTDDDFGEQQVASIAAAARHAPAISILTAIGDRLTAWIGKADPADDITLVVVKKT